MGQRRQQVHLPAVGVDRATQRLAVHRDRPGLVGGGRLLLLLGEPAAHHPVQLVGVDLLQGPPQRRLAGRHIHGGVRPLEDSQPLKRRRFKLAGELGDRGVAARAAKHRRRRDRQHPRQRVSPATPSSGIGQRPKSFQQPTRPRDRIAVQFHIHQRHRFQPT